MCLGIPGRVVDLVDSDTHLATVEVSGVRRTVSVRLLGAGADGVDNARGAGGSDGPGVAVGDWVLVHVGFALAKVDEAEAAATLAALRRLDQRYDDELAAFAGAGSSTGDGNSTDDAVRRGDGPHGPHEGQQARRAAR